jgi:hypothetical protein
MRGLLGVIRDRTGRSCLPIDVRFSPKSTKLLRGREMTRRARSSHSITRSARARKVGDNFNPIAFAVFRLTASSNVVGCSTGMSEGFVPLKILSTIPAARRYLSAERSL